MQQFKRIQTFTSIVNSLSITLFVTVLLLVALEMSARIWYFFRTPPPVGLVAETNNQPAPTSPWNTTYETDDFDDFERDSKSLPSGFTWHPYVYWRRPLYDVPTMHVSQEGVRLTVQPFNESAKNKIFMFGGSTMWGTGVRDKNTLPSLLAERLAETGHRDFYITNFGESAYVSTQSLLTLLLQIRNGNIPQVAIFYEGVNDIASSHLQQKPGLTQHEGSIGFFQNAPRRVEQMSLLELLAMKSSLGKATGNLAIKIGLQKKPVETTPQAKPTIEALAEGTFQNFQETIALARALGKQYGFETYFFWQPSVFTKNQRTKTEQKFTEDTERSMWKHLPKLMELVNSKVREKAPQLPDFIDLHSALNDDPRNLFTDIFHLTEKGNRKIAERIAEHLIRTSVKLNSPLHHHPK